MRKKISAYTIYLIIQAGFGMFFTMMSLVSAIYRVESAGLDPLQLVLVGTVLETTVFLFEIPTGIVADVYSRRLSVIIGYFLIGSGFILEGAWPHFTTILLAQAIWGFGYTFISGAEQAWLADELGEERLGHIYLRGSQLGQLGTVAGIVVASLLGTLALNLPILLGGGLIIGLAAFLALFMPEGGFEPTPAAERQTWQEARQTFSTGLNTIRGRPLLILMMLIALIYGLSSEGLDRLWQAHFLANIAFPTIGDLEPVVWFGVLGIGQVALSIAVAEILRRRVQVDKQQVVVRALLLVNGIIVAALIVFGLSGTFLLATASIWTIQIMRQNGGALYGAWLNKGLNPEARATILSMNGQVDAIGQIVGGPMVGSLALRLGLRAAMITVALMLTPALGLYARAQQLLGRQRRAMDLDPS
ncbi:MAG: MFS transporter [Candidatus Promineifilaceae bacterium]|jgi:DHA3 family tetracycline resistance protein-like MFS transporter